MIHLTSDMTASIAKNFTDILQKYHIGTSLPLIVTDEQNEVVNISCFSATGDIICNIDYSYPFGLAVNDLTISDCDDPVSSKAVLDLLANLKKIKNRIDDVVKPYIKEVL